MHVHFIRVYFGGFWQSNLYLFGRLSINDINLIKGRVITPKINDHKNVHGKENYRAVAIYKQTQQSPGSLLGGHLSEVLSEVLTVLSFLISRNMPNISHQS